MSAGVRAIYRDLGRSVEDTDVGPVLAKKLAELGITDNVGQGSYYVLNNPGEAIQMSYDFDGDGQVDKYEYLSHMVVLLGKMQRHEVDQIMNRFKELDISGDGKISQEDFDLVNKKS